MTRTKLLSIVIFVLINLQVGSTAMDRSTMSFLSDFLKFQTNVAPPAIISAFVCLERERTRQFFRYFSKQHLLLSIHTTIQDMVTQLRATDRNEHVTFVVDMSCDGSQSLLYEADIIKLFNGWCRWILLDNFHYKLVTERNETSESNGRAKDFEDESDIMNRTEENKPVNGVNENMNALNITPTITDPTDISPHIDFILNNLNILLESDITVGKRLSEKKVLLLEVYKRRSYEKPIKKVTGEWVESKGVQQTEPLIRFSRRTNLQKSILRAVMVITNNDSFLHLTNTVNRHIDTISKVNYHLFYHVAEIVNASVDMAVVNTWGYSVNGSWSGLSGYLQRGDADIGATAMFVTKNRYPFMTYIAPTTYTKAGFLFRQPPLSFVENIFTLPFSRSVWLVSAALIAVMGFLLHNALKWELRQENKANTNEENTKATDTQTEVTWSDMVLLSVGAVCQQSTLIEAQGIPGRIITILLFVTVIFLYTSYSACIVALLQSTTTSIRTLHDLLYSGLTLGAHDIVYNRHYFKAASDPVRRAIYIQKVNPPGGPERFLPLKEGLERVRRGQFAFHLELGPGYKFIWDTFLEEEKCNLQTIKFLIDIPDPFVAVSKKTPYKEILTVSYRKVHERGLQHRVNLQFYHAKPECVNRGTSFVSVGIVDCYPALLVLVYGMLVSLAALLIEVLAHRR